MKVNYENKPEMTFIGYHEVYAPGNPQSPDYECGIWVPVQSM